jgi:hypothetical protein
MAEWQDYTDNKESDFQQLLKKNFCRELDYCFALDADCRWGWACYYRRFFRTFARECAQASPAFSKMPNPEGCVWEELKSCVAILELLPYYSPEAPRLVNRDFTPELPSIRAAREFLGNVAEREKPSFSAAGPTPLSGGAFQRVA